MFIVIALSTSRGGAQGVVYFGNRPLNEPVFDVDGTTPVSGTNFIAQLLYTDNTR